MSLGGTVVIQPDTAITHVIYNPGRNASASMLAHELGVSSLSDLPECTVVVKYDWIVESMKVVSWKANLT
jgi:DNA polymerase lambda